MTASINTNDDLGIEPISHTNSESSFLLHMWQLVNIVLTGILFFYAIRVINDLKLFEGVFSETARGLVLTFGTLATSFLLGICLLFNKTRSAKFAFLVSMLALCFAGAIVMFSMPKATPVGLCFLAPIVMLIYGISRELDHWQGRMLRASSSSILQWFVTMLSISMIMRGF